MEKEVKTLSQLEALYFTSKRVLNNSDKYVIRIIWNRYRKLYKQQQAGKLKFGEYAVRRRNYLNIIDDILGYYDGISTITNNK